MWSTSSLLDIAGPDFSIVLELFGCPFVFLEDYIADSLLACITIHTSASF